MKVRSWLCACLALGVLGARVASAQTPPAAAQSNADALATAARQGDAAAVKRLLDEGLDVNTKFRYGTTALSYAADHGRLEVVRLLIARGADVNVKDTFYGATPLTWASSPAQTRTPEHAQIVGLLLRAGAKGNEDALMSAVNAEDIAMMKVILDVGGLSADALADALEAAKTAKNADLAKGLEAAGAKPRADFKMTDADRDALVGTYRNASGSELVIRLTNGALTLSAGSGGSGQPRPMTLLPRSAVLFGVSEAPGLKIEVTVEQGKPTAIVISGTKFTRVGGA
jgi:hypothetical protein